MPIFLSTKSLGYADVNLVSTEIFPLNSRNEIILFDDTPRIFVAPMQSIVDDVFIAKTLKSAPGLDICMHRFDTIKSRVNIYTNAVKNDEIARKKLWFSFSAKEDLSSFLPQIFSASNYHHINLLLDVAHAATKVSLDRIVELNNYFHGVYEKLNVPRQINFMFGNVHSVASLDEIFSIIGKSMHKHVNYFIRVGIGGGAVCDTSRVTGFTRGQITEITECYALLCNSQNIFIVADGGVKDSGCAVKAFGAGADSVMMGGYFSNAEESYSIRNNIMEYWGGASLRQSVNLNKIPSNIEGKSKPIYGKDIKSIESLYTELVQGILSGLSYGGVKHIKDFIGNGTFEEKNANPTIIIN